MQFEFVLGLFKFCSGTLAGVYFGSRFANGNLQFSHPWPQRAHPKSFVFLDGHLLYITVS